jgi:hypothetical protein
MAELVEDDDLWMAEDFDRFKERAENIVAKKVMPAWATLERKTECLLRTF